MQTCSETDLAHLERAVELAAQRRRPRQPQPGRRRRDRGRRRRCWARAGTRSSAAATPRSTRSPPAAAPTSRGATLYVTLEPCCHFGRTPPCTDAILAAGIRRVVVGSDDPTEKASGRGLGILRDEGVEVVVADGELAQPRAAAQPGLPQARPHRPAVGAVQVGDDARRQGRDARRRLEVDLGRREPRARAPLARLGRRGRDRDRHRARRRPAADRARRERPPPADARRVRLARAPAAVLAAGRRRRRGAADRRRLARRRRAPTSTRSRPPASR